jgi:BON domain
MIMFVENYRRENAESMMAGGESSPLPYPKISDGDWRGDTIKKSMLVVLAWKYATSPFAITVELAGMSLLAWHLILG